MAMTEKARHELYEAMKEVIGVENTSTLMDAFPPVGWNDVARRSDLENLANQLRAEWRADMNRQTLALFASNLTLAALVFAAAQLV